MSFLILAFLLRNSFSQAISAPKTRNRINDAKGKQSHERVFYCSLKAGTGYNFYGRFCWQ